MSACKCISTLHSVTSNVTQASSPQLIHHSSRKKTEQILNSIFSPRIVTRSPSQGISTSTDFEVMSACSRVYYHDICRTAGRAIPDSDTVHSQMKTPRQVLYFNKIFHEEQRLTPFFDKEVFTLIIYTKNLKKLTIIFCAFMHVLLLLTHLAHNAYQSTSAYDSLPTIRTVRVHIKSLVSLRGNQRSLPSSHLLGRQQRRGH